MSLAVEEFVMWKDFVTSMCIIFDLWPLSLAYGTVHLIFAQFIIIDTRKCYATEDMYMSWQCLLANAALSVPAYLKEHLVPRPATRYTDFARRSFSYAAPVTWNSLPANITLCDSEHGFKRQLKTFLFR